MANFKLLLLPGDGIGPEVMGQAEAIVSFLDKQGIVGFSVERDLVGGAAYDAHGVAISDAAMDRAQEADVVLFGAVGGPKWDKVPYQHRPEAGLLRLRRIWGFLPICALPSAIQPLRTPLRSKKSWSRGST